MFRKCLKVILSSMMMLFFLLGCTVSKDGLYQLSNQSYSQMMSYIIRWGNSVVVVDGGMAEDEANLIQNIKKISDDNTVDAWIITHYHQDHTGALAEYLESESDDIKIKKIYYNFPSRDWVSKYDADCLSEYDIISNALSTFNSKVIVSKNMDISTSDLQIKVIRTFNPEITVNGGNNSSSVYKVTCNNKTILFLGDLGEEGGEELIKNCKEEIENMDYVQMAHHGQAGVSKEVYQIIHPKYCLWPTPDWLWINKDNQYQTDLTKEWIREIGVKKNYVADKGTIKIDLK